MCRRQVQDIYSLPRSDFCGQLLIGTTGHHLNIILKSWNVKTWVKTAYILGGFGAQHTVQVQKEFQPWFTKQGRNAKWKSQKKTGGKSHIGRVPNGLWCLLVIFSVGKMCGKKIKVKRRDKSRILKVESYPLWQLIADAANPCHKYIKTLEHVVNVMDF